MKIVQHLENIFHNSFVVQHKWKRYMNIMLMAGAVNSELCHVINVFICTENEKICG